MKKMIKILSLVLALAMVLGMTSMAAAMTAPTNIIISDDFSDLDSIDTFTSTRTNVGAELGTTNYTPGAFSAGIGAVIKAKADASTPLTGKAATHFWSTTAYGGTPFELVKDDAGNTVALRDTAGDKRGYLMYALPTAFDYEDAYQNKKAIVFQYDWKPYLFRTDGVSYGQLANTMGVNTEDAEGVGTGNYGVKPVANAETGAIDTFNLSYQGGDTPFTGLAANQYYSVQRVYRQYNLYDEDKLYDGTNATGNLSQYLVHFSPFERRYDYAGHFVEAGTANQRKSIQAFYIPFNNNRQDEYANVLIYEVSLASEDFYLETTTVNDVELDGALELVFSQPLSANVGSGGSGDPDKTEGTWLAEKIVVNDGTKDLVYGTDYTVELDEKVVGNQVKGTLTVIPAVDWAYDKTITVTIPGNMRSVARRTIYAETNKVATFNTLKAPSFNITLNAYEGLAEGTTIAADAMAGKTVYFKADAVNTTGRAIDGVLAIGIYEGDNLVKYAYADKAFADAGSNSFAAAFKLEAGQTAKAFVKGTASTVTYGD